MARDANRRNRSAALVLRLVQRFNAGAVRESGSCRHGFRYIEPSTMARRGDSVIGIDLGTRVLKAVSLRRKADHRFILTSFTSRELPQELNTADDLAQQIKQLLRDLGGSAKGCAVAISDPASI